MAPMKPSVRKRGYTSPVDVGGNEKPYDLRGVGRVGRNV